MAEFCRRDPRCRAGVNIDGAPHGPVIQAGLKQPFMLLLSDHSAEAGPDTDRIVADVQSLYDHLPPDITTVGRHPRQLPLHVQR